MCRAAFITTVVVVMCPFLTGSTTQPAPADLSDVPGFWLGLLHGVIVPFAFVVSFFTETRIYSFPNNGGWYDFGFVLGIFTIGGGGAAVGK